MRLATALVLAALLLAGCQRDGPTPGPAAPTSDPFDGTRAGDERTVGGVRLCWCPAGTFVMGSPPSEPERRPGEDQVEVTLTRGFWCAKFETTQGDWRRVVGTFPENRSPAQSDDPLPMGTVNFGEAESFCSELTKMAQAAGDLPAAWAFRLPTEAQWEYACRAGTTTATSFGDTLDRRQANFSGKPYNGGDDGWPSLGHAMPVGRYPPNPWGIHDMHGNTYEWCRDWYHFNLPGGVDPDLRDVKGTPSEHGDHSRVRRSGCWVDDGWPCRSAFRLRFEPERRWDHIGFRVVAVRPR